MLARLRGCVWKLALAALLLGGLLWWGAPWLAAIAIGQQLPQPVPEAGLTIDRVALAPDPLPALTATIDRDFLRRVVGAAATAAPQWPWRFGLVRPGQTAEGTIVALPWRLVLADSATPVAIAGTCAPPPPGILIPVGTPIPMQDGSREQLRLRIDSLRIRDDGPARWRVVAGGVVRLGDRLGVQVPRVEAIFTYRWQPVDGGHRFVVVPEIRTMRLGVPGFGWLHDACQGWLESACERLAADLIVPGAVPRRIPIDLQVGTPLHPED